MSRQPTPKSKLYQNRDLLKETLYKPCEVAWTAPLKPQGDRKQRFALEMEFCLYHSSDLQPLGLDPKRVTTQSLLVDLEKRWPGSRLKVDSSTQQVVGLELKEGGNFSIEPGGQLEFATKPHDSFLEMVQETEHALKEVENLRPSQIIFLSHGTNPLAPKNMPLLVPKWRYLALSQYFQSQPGGRGLHMSRYTGTVQPNLDVDQGASWDEAVRLSYLFTPFARAMFANSRYFYQQPSSFYSERQEIWKYTDPGRSGVPRGITTATDPACTYSKWAMQAPVMFIEGVPLEKQPSFNELKFGQWLEECYLDICPCIPQWETHISTLFPEVRLRGFLEIRSTDAQPFSQTAAPISLWTGWLQSPKARQGLRNLETQINQELKESYGERFPLSEFSELQLDHHIFKEAHWHHRLIELAKQGHLELGSHDFALKSLEHFAQYLRTPKFTGSALEFVKQTGTLTPSRDWVQFTHL